MWLTVPLLLAAAAVGQDIFQMDLLVNGNANDPIEPSWKSHEGTVDVIRANKPLQGQLGEWYFRGPIGTSESPAPVVATIYQSFSVGKASLQIDASDVAAGFGAWMGGNNTQNSTVAVRLVFMTADSTKTRTEDVSMSTALLESPQLQYNMVKTCTVPPGTRTVSVTVTFTYDADSGFSSDAAIDGMSFRLLKTESVKYVDDINLIPMPSAESPAALCVWNSSDELVIVPKYDDGLGYLQFAVNSTETVTVTRLIDIRPDADAIDHAERSASLVARVGGSAMANASGEVTVTFLDEKQLPLAGAKIMTTGQATLADRGGVSRLIKRNADISSIHAQARWARVDMIFHNDGVKGTAGVDGVDFRVRYTGGTMPPTGPTDPPTSTMYDKELVINGNAEQPVGVGWVAGDAVMEVTRATTSIVGKEGTHFFRGPVASGTEPAPTVDLWQEVDISEISGDVDNGIAAAGFSARVGSIIDGGSVQIYVIFRDADGSSLGSMSVNGDHAGKLDYVHTSSCKIPPKTMKIRVYIILERKYGMDNAAAVDAVSLRLAKNIPVPFGDDVNLIPLPSAESPAASCVWGNENITVTPVYPGGDGSFQYTARVPGLTVALLWIDIQSDKVAIDHHDRHVSLNTLAGAKGVSADKATITVNFYDEGKAVDIGSFSTKAVTAEDRDNATKLVERNEIVSIPKHARWMKVQMKFENSDTFTAALDQLELRMRHIVPVPPPDFTDPPTSTFYDREHVINGNADDEVSVGWTTTDDEMHVIRSNDAVVGKVGEWAFRGPRKDGEDDAADYVEFFQQVDVREIAADINAKHVAMGFSAMVGSYSEDYGSVDIYLTFLDEAKETFGEEINVEKWREKPASLEFIEKVQCELPVKTRYIEVLIYLDSWYGETNPVAIDAISLRLTYVGPVKFHDEINLIPVPGAESTASMCLWKSEDFLTIIPIYPGGGGELQFASIKPFVTYATRWVDITQDGAYIDRVLQQVSFGADIGGNGTSDESAELIVSFFGVDKKENFGSATTGKVSAKDRFNLPMLLSRNQVVAIPKLSRWVKVQMAFHNNGSTNAAMDNLELRISHIVPTLAPPTGPTEPPRSPMFARNLIVNGDAESEVGGHWKPPLNEDEVKVQRSNAPLSGKFGSWYFRGPSGTDAAAAPEEVTMIQHVDVSDVASDIDSGVVAAGLSAFLGSDSVNDSDTTVSATFYNADGDALGFELFIVGWSHEEPGLFLDKSTECAMPVDTKSVAVSVTMEYSFGGDNVAAADGIVFRLVHLKDEPFHADTNVFPVPSAEAVAVLCMWDSSTLSISRAYKGGDGMLQYSSTAAYKHHVSKWFDVSSDAPAIDRQQRLYVLAARIGGSGSQDDSGEVRIAFYDTAKNIIAGYDATTGTLSAADRGDEAVMVDRQVMGKDSNAVPPNTRHVKVDLEFHNSASATGSAIDEVEFRLRHVIGTLEPHPGPTPAPISAIFGRQLVVNGDADEEIAAPWGPEGSLATRSNEFLAGKVGDWFFRGPKAPAGGEAASYVEFKQTIDLSEARREIDLEQVALGFGFMAGGASDFEVEVWMDITLRDADGQSTSYEDVKYRGTAKGLFYQAYKKCIVPKATRLVELYMTFDYFAGVDNDAAVDAMNMHLIHLADPKVSTGDNLLPQPSAETPASVCLWDPEAMKTAVMYIGGEGRHMFQAASSGVVVVEKWIDLSAEAQHIDRSLRHSSLSAHIGGDTLKDSGMVQVAFYDKDKVLLSAMPAMTTYRVWPGQRGFHPRLLPRHDTLEGTVPVNTRYARVDLVFNNTNNETDSAGIDAVSLTLWEQPPPLPPPPVTVPPTSKLFGRNLLINGDADKPATTGWRRYFAKVAAISTMVPLDGKWGERFFRGPLGSLAKPAKETYMYQDIVVKSIAGFVDRGHVALGFTGRLGAMTADEATAKVEISFWSATWAKLDVLEVEVDQAARENKPGLLPRTLTECAVPKNTRVIEVKVKFIHESALVNNDAAVDALSVRLLKTKEDYADGINLLPAPSAENSAGLCVWNNTDLAVEIAYPGADGRYQYEMPLLNTNSVEKWIDVSAASKDIDAGQRIAFLGARVGGKGAVADSGELTVTFYGDDRQPIGAVPSMSTGRVSAAERGNTAGFVQRHNGTAIPKLTRWVRVEMVFANGATSTGAALDDVEFSVNHVLPPVPTTAPGTEPQETVYGLQLVKNSEADEEVSVGWSKPWGTLEVERTSQALEGKSGTYFFRGPTGTDATPAPSYVTMQQRYSLSSIGEDIDNGLVAVGLSGLLGGIADKAGVVFMDAIAYSMTGYLNREYAAVSPWRRGQKAKLVRAYTKMCTLPKDTRILVVSIAFFHANPAKDNDAAADAIFLTLLKKPALKFQESVNLVPAPNAESPAAPCLWDNVNVTVGKAYDGGIGLQYQSKIPGSVNASLWIDISGIAHTVDGGQRMAMIEAWIGGSAGVADSGEVTVGFYDIHKIQLGPEPMITTGTVTPEERNEETKLLERSGQLLVPKGARFAKVSLVFSNTDVTEGAAVDQIDFRIPHLVPTAAPPGGPTEPPRESIFVRELLQNTEAYYDVSDGWRGGFVSGGGIRSTAPLAGKSGNSFFRGRKGTPGKPSKSAVMYQWIYVKEAEDKIMAGKVGAGLFAMAGSMIASDATAKIFLKFYKDGFFGHLKTFSIVSTAEKRNYEAKLIPIRMRVCSIPVETTKILVSVYMTDTNTVQDNHAAFDAISLRLHLNEEIEFADYVNLIPMPSAENPVALCMWQTNNVTVHSGYPNADGLLQYMAKFPGLTTVSKFIDISPDQDAIDTGDRYGVLSALRGGAGAEDDSGELAVSYFDADKNPLGAIPAASTGTVTAVERDNEPDLLSAVTSSKIPVGSRFARVDLIFHNSDSTATAAVDMLEFFLRASPPTLAPSTGPPTGHIYERELLHNRNANYEPKIGWTPVFRNMMRSSKPLIGKVGDWFFRGPMGTHAKAAAGVVSVSQSVSLAEAGDDVKKGLVAMGIRGRLGSMHDDSASMGVWIDYYNGETLHPESDWMHVSAASRSGFAGLLPRFTHRCSIPQDTDRIEVYMQFEHKGNLLNNDAAVDDLSLKVIKREDKEFIEDENLAPFPHAESPAAPCLWDASNLTVEHSFDGGDGDLQYTSTLGNLTNASKTFDLSSIAIAIDAQKRHATLSAHVGGTGTANDTGEVTVTFLDAEKKPMSVGPAMTTGVVLASQRNGGPKLLERAAPDLVVPSGARWATLVMFFHNSPLTRGAAIDKVDFRVLPIGVTPAPETPVPTDAPAGTSAPVGTPTPTSPPTPGGQSGAAAGREPSKPINSGFRAAAQAFGSVAIAGAVVSGPAAASHLAQTIGVFGAAVGCGRGNAAGDVAPLWALSPFQMKVGASTPGAYYRGAVVGNIVILLLVIAVLGGIVAVLKAKKYQEATQQWRAAMAAVCFPSCLVIPVGLLAPGLMYGAIGAVTAGGTGGDYVCAVLAFGVVGGTVAGTAYFAATARRSTLDSMDFEVDCARQGGLAWVMSDTGNWICTTNQIGSQQQADLQMASMLYRPYRGTIFLWWVPVDLFVAATVSGAAGAAGTSCKGVAIVMVLFVGFQAIATIATRPFACRLRTILTAVGEVLAAIAAAVFALVVHRNDGDPALLSTDGLMGVTAIFIIMAIIVFFADGILGTVKFVMDCRSRTFDSTHRSNLDALFGGQLGQELIAEGDKALGDEELEEDGPMLGATTSVLVNDEHPHTPRRKSSIAPAADDAAATDEEVEDEAESPDADASRGDDEL